MITIPISRSLYDEIARIVGPEPDLVGRVLASQYWHRKKEQAERREIECLVAKKVIAKIEQMEGHPPGYLLERHPNGKQIQEAERAIYRYLAMVIIVKKFGFHQNHIMEGMKMHHSTYNHAIQVISDLWFSSKQWQETIRRLQREFEIEIT